MSEENPGSLSPRRTGHAEFPHRAIRKARIKGLPRDQPQLIEMLRPRNAMRWQLWSLAAPMSVTHQSTAGQVIKIRKTLGDSQTESRYHCISHRDASEVTASIKMIWQLR